MAEDYTAYAKAALNELVRRLFARKQAGLSIEGRIDDAADGDLKLPITYGELAKVIGFPEPHSGNGFADKMAKMLGRLGEMLRDVGTILGKKIPQIQALVVNKGTNLPGEGIDEFIPGYKASDEAGRKTLVATEYGKIAAFSGWKTVIDEVKKQYP